MSTGQTTPQARSLFSELLDLFGIAPGERVSICSQKPGGRFEDGAGQPGRR